MRRVFLLPSLLISFALVLAISPVYAGKPSTMKGCLVCHKEETKVVRGKMVSHSPKFSSISVDVGPVVWIIKYDDKTRLVGADSLDAVKRDKEMAVTYTGDEKNPLAVSISVKKPFVLPEEKQVSLPEMKRLVTEGPEKGGYMLVDSRPPDAYNAGHIPGAVSIPFPKLTEMKEKALPRDKSTSIIFYCGGFT